MTINLVLDPKRAVPDIYGDVLWDVLDISLKFGCFIFEKLGYSIKTYQKLKSTHETKNNGG